LDISIQKIHLGKKRTKVVVLQFSGALNPGDAQNPGNYSLATVRGHRSKVVPLSQSNYNPATNTVTLMTCKPLASSQTPTVTLNSTGLLDWLGRPVE
jgi:hypothetical protein